MTQESLSRESEFFAFGGALSATAPSYVQREADEQLFELAQNGKFAYVLTPRQMGKTSLVHRTAQRLRNVGVVSARVDLSPIGGESAEKWYLAIVANLTRSLNISLDAIRQPRLSIHIETWWQKHQAMDVTQRFIEFLRTVVLEQIQVPIVIFIDEIDSTLRLKANFSDDFFVAIRHLYNFRDVEPSFGRLSFVLLGAASPTDLIKEATRTPFNIAEAVVLYDFTIEESAILQQGLEHALPGQGERIFRRIYSWTIGHPYLTQKLCNLVVRLKKEQWSETDVDELVQKEFLSEAARGEDNIKFVQNQILRQSDRDQLLDVYRKIRAGRKVEDDTHSIAQNQLKLAGLVKAEAGCLVVRNPIYARVFNLNWVRTYTPTNWTRIVATISTLVAIIAISLIIHDFYWIETQKDSATSDFVDAISPTEQLHYLARLFTLKGILFSSDNDILVRERFFGFDRNKQVGLFKSTGRDFSTRDVVIVVQKLYIYLANVDSVDTTPLLQAMENALEPEHVMEEQLTYWHFFTSIGEKWGLLKDPEFIRNGLHHEIESWLEGRSLAQKELYEQAQDAYDRALILNPNNPATLFERASIYVHLKKYSAALHDLDQIIGIARSISTLESTQTNSGTSVTVVPTGKSTDTILPTGIATDSVILNTNVTPMLASPISTSQPLSILSSAITPTAISTATPTLNSIISNFKDLSQRLNVVRNLINNNPFLADELVKNKSKYPNLLAYSLIPPPTFTPQTVRTPTLSLSINDRVGLPYVLSTNFECADPTRLSPWLIHRLIGDPEIAYARERFLGGCDATGIFEHLEGIDSLMILAQDIETPPDPGKPFDIAFSQSFSTSPGVDYSVSGWMLSLCGGSAIPNDCPEGMYMAKLVGLDPTGGTDPLSPQIVWTENRQNFTESRWVNLRTSVRAQAKNMTVFARLNSPFLHHGNHGYLDAISVVRSPIAYFTSMPSSVAGKTLTLTWESEQSPDISGIEGGAYQLLIDIEARQLPSGEWKTVITDSVGINNLPYSVKCGGSSYQFRIRPRSEQSPDVGPGVFPNHRYPGVWSDLSIVNFQEIDNAATPCFN